MVPTGSQLGCHAAGAPGTTAGQESYFPSRRCLVRLPRTHLAHLEFSHCRLCGRKWMKWAPLKPGGQKERREHLSWRLPFPNTSLHLRHPIDFLSLAPAAITLPSPSHNIAEFDPALSLCSTWSDTACLSSTAESPSTGFWFASVMQPCRGCIASAHSAHPSPDSSTCLRGLGLPIDRIEHSQRPFENTCRNCVDDFSSR